jgi:hypothetical protein
MTNSGFQSELAQQLRAWAELEQCQDGRQGLIQLADEYEEIAAVASEPPAVLEPDELHREAA